MTIEQMLGAGANLTQEGAEYLERLVKELDVPPSRYEEAERRYESVGEWLCRDESSLKELEPDVFVQGSFRLGTPIRPVNDTEHYDIDLVCSLSASKSNLTQQQLKMLLGVEMRLYAKEHGMSEPGEARRCWTLDYAEGAQFHLDALPAVPDGEEKQRLLREASLSSDWSSTAIAITDIDHPEYTTLQAHWPHSNPRGYMEWFRSRMLTNFNQIREALALEANANVEDIPSYKVKTPLQQAVQVLKRHRDIMFSDNSEDKPISVIITTLSGLAYAGERNVADALNGILQRMESHVQQDRYGKPHIPNPTDPQENFADRWIKSPVKRENFYKWLEKARVDFRSIVGEHDQQRIYESVSKSFGEREARAALDEQAPRSSSLSRALRRATSLFSASHKKDVPWPANETGWVSIDKVTWSAKGFSRPQRLLSDGQRLMKNAALTFEASTNVPRPYDIFWQIVNTGREAEEAGQLRGGFDSGGTVVQSLAKHSEITGYTGTHSVQCFIVKQGHLVARSSIFIVKVK